MSCATAVLFLMQKCFQPLRQYLEHYSTKQSKRFKDVFIEVSFAKSRIMFTEEQVSSWPSMLKISDVQRGQDKG